MRMAFRLLARLLPVLVLIAALPVGLRAATAPAPAVAEIGFCKPYNWLFGGWVAPPRIPLLGDINGDGYADFLYASPQDKLVDVSLNGRGWKPLRGQRLLSDLPQPIRAMALGHFGGRGLDLGILCTDGSLLISHNDGSGKFAAPSTVVRVPGVSGPAWLAAVRPSSGHGSDDVVVISRDGQSHCYDSASGAPAGEFHTAGPVLAAAAFTGSDGVSELAALARKRVRIYRLGTAPGPVASFQAPPGEMVLAMGDINGDGIPDVLANGRVFLGPDFKNSVPVPGWQTFSKPVVAMMADVAGHGRSDIVVQHEGPDYFGSTEADCDLYITYLGNDADWDCDGLTNAEEAKLGSDPLDRCTSHDGILDGWKVHGFWGVDFPGMGASPLHKDIFVMNLPYDNVPVAQMEKFMRDRVVPFYGSLPYTNRDGTKGFAIHWMTENPPYPSKPNEGKGWSQVADETFPRDRIGLYHWMLVGGMGGGGQSGQLADAGSGGMLSWIHEFGHQLGLSHSGKWNSWSPTYTSLMNYSYSYQFEGDPKKIHFSTGELAGLILNETHLPGKVPYPMAELQFLTGPPYHFHLRPAGKDATYVDWGWTGVFSDRTVKANITFGYGVSAGERLQPSGTQTFHYDGPFELMTDYQASLAVHRGRLYMLTASRGPLDPKAPRPASVTLVLQSYRGKHAWTKPVTIAPAVTGDPFAASDGMTFYVVYPTADGLMLRSGPPDRLGPPQLVPDSKGTQASAVNWNGTLYLFLFSGPDHDLTCRTVQGRTVGPVLDLGIRSSIAPGPAVDTIRHELLLGTAETSGSQPYLWQIHRLRWDRKARRFAEVSWSFVGGEKSGWAGNRRPTLIFDPDRANGPDGRLYWIAAGLAEPLTKPTAFFLAQTIAYKDVNDGWLLWRYYDEWTNTHSGIGAAWYGKDIVLATTWASGTPGGDGGVFLAYHGTTIENVDMADFDDISLMANYGMERSIGTFATMPPANALGK